MFVHGDFGTTGDGIGRGILTEIGKCLRLNHELPAPFLANVNVASKDLDRFSSVKQISISLLFASVYCLKSLISHKLQLKL